MNLPDQLVKLSIMGHLGRAKFNPFFDVISRFVAITKYVIGLGAKI